MVLSSFWIWIPIVYYAIAWTLLTTTSASLLLPHWSPFCDRLIYALSILWDPRQFSCKLDVIGILFKRVFFFYPLFAYFWTLDEILYGKYRQVRIVKPVIAVCAPRSGSTSLHNMLALDERFYTPTMTNMLIPSLTLHRILFWINQRFPALLPHAMDFARRLIKPSPELVAAHPTTYDGPEVDDVLIAEWHFLTSSAARTLPVPEKWYQYHVKKNQQFQLSARDRHRTNRLQKLIMQKFLYNQAYFTQVKSQQDGKSGESPCATTTPNKRLLLKTHRSHWATDLYEVYPDATFLGILRPPQSMIRSLAHLTHVGMKCSKSVDIFADLPLLQQQDKTTKDDAGKFRDRSNDVTTWSGAAVGIMSDLMGCEADLFGDHPRRNEEKSDGGGNSDEKYPHGHYTTFASFKNNNVQAITDLYQAAGLEVTEQFQKALYKAVKDHQTYKKRFAYTNPTLRELEIDESPVLQRPNVKRYMELLNQGPSKRKTTKE